MSRLLAKSVPAGQVVPESATLLGHLQEVAAAALVLMEASGLHQLQALGLESHRLRSFQRCVCQAAALHDLGKLNSGFQRMLKKRGETQPLRHEVVSWFLVTRNLQDWLTPLREDPLEAMAMDCAILGHHRLTSKPGNSGLLLELPLDHPDAASVFGWLAEQFQLPSPPALANCTIHTSEVLEELEAWRLAVEQSFRKLNDQDRRFVAGVKACLIGADVAGSALRATCPKLIEKWLRNLPGRERLEQVLVSRLNSTDIEQELRPFQVRVRDSAERITLVRAGCGTGKTLAAYAWAARQNPNRRLYFCYPTTGTATEGFRDYLFAEHHTLEAQLFHSRAEVDLDLILGVHDSDEPLDESHVRIESLRSWSTPIVACTVDTVLGLMENTRAGLYGWPALANASFVFDEIHCYDDRLFNALLCFLRELPGLPVLLMTASLQEGRLQALRKLGIAEVDGEPELEQRKRYRRVFSENPYPLALSHPGRVLWVCNTVSTAREVAERLNVPVYHSRFRYHDRVQRHTELVESFKTATALGVATQVAEVSLDLSASLLVTQLCPVPSLIQRLGRLARHLREGEAPGQFLVLEPERPEPYRPEDLAEARLWLERLGTEPLSQADLSRAWAEVRADERFQLEPRLGWQHGGPRTEPGQIRDGSPQVTVILESDASDVRRAKVLVESVTIPMLPPRQYKWHEWPRLRGYPVAPSEFVDYDPLRGASWR